MKRLIFLLAFAGIAHGQAWDSNLISWSAPQKCTDGTAITNCAVTSYRIERAPKATSATFAPVGTAPANATSFIHTGAAEGMNCYRVIAVTAAANSAASSPPACRTNVKPVSVPDPPGDVVVTGTTAYNIRADFGKFAFVKGSKWGTATKGAACDESRCIGEYCVVASRRSLNPRPPEGEYKIARCG